MAGLDVFKPYLKPYVSITGSIKDLQIITLCKYTGEGIYMFVIYDPDSPSSHYFIGYILSNGNPEAGQDLIKLINKGIEVSLGWYYRPSIITDAVKLKMVTYLIA